MGIYIQKKRKRKLRDSCQNSDITFVVENLLDVTLISRENKKYSAIICQRTRSCFCAKLPKQTCHATCVPDGIGSIKLIQWLVAEVKVTDDDSTGCDGVFTFPWVCLNECICYVASALKDALNKSRKIISVAIPCRCFPFAFWPTVSLYTGQALK